MDMPEQQLAKVKVTKSDLLKRYTKIVARFIKNHKILVSVIALIIVMIVVLFNTIPVVNVNNTKFVNLDTSVRILKGQTAQLKNTDVSIQIQNFVKDACPTGETCYGSGDTVEYTFVVDGKYYTTNTAAVPPDVGYKIETIDTDYETYVDVKIIKSE